MGPDYRGRLKKLRELAKEKGIDAVLLSSPRDITYYTGSSLTGDAAFLLVGMKSKPLLMVSCLSNYTHETRTANVCFISEFRDIIREIKGYRKIGFDEKNLSTGVFLKLKGIRLRPFASHIKAPRMVKEGWEVKQIKKAIGITEGFFRKTRLLGRTEEEVAREIMKKTIELGLRESFSPIIAAGRNSSFIHYLPGRKKISAGDMVIMDIGVRFNGYCSDLTRTFCRKPEKKQKQVYEDLLNIQSEVIDNIRSGVRFDVIDRFSSNLYKKRGYKKMHSIGHGVGLSVHEKPVSEDTIQNGMVFTVEPGIYIKKWGGCRVEDILHVKNNKAVLLSGFSRDLNQ